MPIALESEQAFHDRYVLKSAAAAERRKKAKKRADCKAVFDPICPIELKEAYAAAIRDTDLRRGAEIDALVKAFSAGMTTLQAKKLAQAAVIRGMDLRRDAETDALVKAFAAAGGMTMAEAKKAAHIAGKAAEKLTLRQRDLITKIEFIERRQRERQDEAPEQTAKERVQLGYQWAGGWVAGKWFQSAFVEKGLRSEDHWLLARFAASTRKASKGLFAGMGNGDARKQFFRKLQGLDQTHTAMNVVMRDCFRVDLDRDFKSIAELMHLIDEAGCPMPNLIVWIACETKPAGTINRPHLWYFLPDGKAVFGHGNTSDRLLKGVAAAIYGRLEHLGADPGGLANLHDGKSPLSPHASFFIANETHLPTLSELAEVLDVTLDCETMARLMSIRKFDRTTVGTRSNQVYDWAYASSSLLARELYKKGIVDAASLDFDRVPFAEIIETEMHRRARLEFPEFKGAELDALLEVCSSRAVWAAEKFSVVTLSGGVNRGAARDQIKPDADMKTRHQAGQAYTSTVRVQNTIKKIAKAMLFDLRIGRVPNFDLVVKSTGITDKTVEKHWEAAMAFAKATDFQRDVAKIKMAISSISVEELAALGRGSTQDNQPNSANLGAAASQHHTGQPSTADPEPGDPGQLPHPCIFEAFAEAHRQSRRAAASGIRAA